MGFLKLVVTKSHFIHTMERIKYFIFWFNIIFFLLENQIQITLPLNFKSFFSHFKYFHWFWSWSTKVPIELIINWIFIFWGESNVFVPWNDIWKSHFSERVFSWTKKLIFLAKLLSEIIQFYYWFLAFFHRKLNRSSKIEGACLRGLLVRKNRRLFLN